MSVSYVQFVVEDTKQGLKKAPMMVKIANNPQNLAMKGGKNQLEAKGWGYKL